jgi:hypothetical protein
MNKSDGGVTGSWVKWSTIAILGFVAMAGVVLIVLPTSKPPREEKVIENFNTHRPAYERLRTMLLADDQLLRVAEWGVETDSPVGIHHPPEGGFSVDRYHEYLSLFKEVGAMGASRGRRGEHPEDACVLVWAAGWAGDTRHVDTCWLEHEPPNQLASLDAFYQTPKPRHPEFRHIDGNWYLWADW